MKRNKIIYYSATGLLTLLMLFSASMYFFNHDEVAKLFEGFGYPTYIIYRRSAITSCESYYFIHLFNL